MIVAFDPAKLAHLRGILVARQSVKFSDFGVAEDPEQFVDGLVERFGSMYPSFTIDNLLVRPREGLRYCDSVRQGTGYFDLPDDVILQAILNRRKHG